MRNRGHERLLRALALFAGALVLLTVTVLGEGYFASAPGDRTGSLVGMTVDYSHMENGYICVKSQGERGRLKLRVSMGDQKYTYDLPSDGQYVVFPLQMGSGTYLVSLYEQISGNRYGPLSDITLSAYFTSEMNPYLYPNQYVPYDEQNAAVAASYELCADLTDDRAKIDAVREYVVNRFVYSYVRALTVKSGYLPDLNELLDTGTGICFDFAALFACMLRVQGIPTQMVIGYADSDYHAWNNVYADGVWTRYDVTSEITGSKYRTYTEERRY